MKDAWKSGDPYEYFMGRWSRLVAQLFIDWLSPTTGLRWLDVGCGSGALSEVVINHHQPAELTAIDQSEGFVQAAQQRLGNMARCKVGNALALPMEEDSVDIVISGLVLNFIPEPEKALAEMRRVAAPEGTVALYIWDYAGQMDFLKIFWDTAVKLDSGALKLHEGKRFPNSNAAALDSLFEKGGFSAIETTPLVISTHFRDFDDYWNPFLGGQGPAPTYVLSLDDTNRNKLRNELQEQLPVKADGSIPLTARAWAVRANV